MRKRVSHLTSLSMMQNIRTRTTQTSIPRRYPTSISLPKMAVSRYCSANVSFSSRQHLHPLPNTQRRQQHNQRKASAPHTDITQPTHSYGIRTFTPLQNATWGQISNARGPLKRAPVPAVDQACLGGSEESLGRVPPQIIGMREVTKEALHHHALRTGQSPRYVM